MLQKALLVLTVALLLVCTVALAAMGADPAPLAPAVTSPGVFDLTVSWFIGHQVALGFLVMAVIDFIYSINPEWKSNGALHFIYLFVQKIAGKSPAP